MSKKIPPKKDIARIRQLLGANSIPEEHASADLRWAVRTLAGEVTAPPGAALRPEVAYALVEELVDRRATEILAELVQQDHRTVSKAARTALHHMRSLKVEVEVPAQAGPQRLGTGQPIQQELQSLVTIYDGRWERLIWIGQDAPSGVQVYQCRVSAQRGLIDFRAGSTTRREFRGRARDIRHELGGEMIGTPLAIWFIEEAARRSREAGRSLPDAYARASQSLGDPAAGDHPALAVAPAGSASPLRLLELLELSELRYWNPGTTFLRRLQLKLDEVTTSRLVLNQGQRRERIEAVMKRELAEYFTEQRCEACHQLLLDTAHLLLVKGAQRDAADLRAAAAVFELGPAQVADHAFARGFIDRVVQRPEGSPPPDEGPASEGPASEGGGLILPP